MSTPPPAASDNADKPVRRTWYASKAALDAFDAVVDSSYHDLRGAYSKGTIIAALLGIAVAHRDELHDILGVTAEPPTSATRREDHRHG